MKQKKSYKTRLINESGEMPFKEKEIDVVFCNSVIEHYTIKKNTIWSCKDGLEFKRKSLES